MPKTGAHLGAARLALARPVAAHGVAIERAQSEVVRVLDHAHLVAVAVIGILRLLSLQKEKPRSLIKGAGLEDTSYY